VGVLSKFSNLTDLATWNPGSTYFFVVPVRVNALVKGIMGLVIAVTTDSALNCVSRVIYFNMIKDIQNRREMDKRSRQITTHHLSPSKREKS